MDNAVKKQEEAVVYSLLNAVRLEGGLANSEDIIILAMEIKGRKACTFAGYEQAIQTCIDRAWIKVLSEEDVKTDSKRWEDYAAETKYHLLPYRVGSIDFTPTGWSVYSHMRDLRLGPPMLSQYAEGIHSFFGLPGQVSLTSGSEQALSHKREQILHGSDELAEGSSLRSGHEIGEIKGPHSIGPWWATRFYQLPVAYQLDIFFDPPDLHPYIASIP